MQTLGLKTDEAVSRWVRTWHKKISQLSEWYWNKWSWYYEAKLILLAVSEINYLTAKPKQIFIVDKCQALEIDFIWSKQIKALVSQTILVHIVSEVEQRRAILIANYLPSTKTTKQ